MAAPQQMLMSYGAGAGGSVSTDPNTLLLLHFDGSHGSTTFTDSSMYGSVMTPHGTAGPALSTSVSQFGGSSGEFSSGGAQYLDTPYDSRFSTGSGDFCIEWWGQVPSFGSGLTPFSRRNASVYCPLEFKVLSASLVQVLMSDGTNTGWATTAGLYTPTAITTGALHHFVLQKSGSSIRYAQDGAWSATVVTLASMSTTTDPIYIARGGDSTWDGYIDEFRWSDCVRYTHGTSFTPPIAAFT